jgi:hypothetical protein
MPKEKFPPSKFLAINLNIPNHIEELKKVDVYLTGLNKKINSLKTNKAINKNVHQEYLDKIVHVLLYVGGLSNPAFSIYETLEDTYTKTYKKSPQLGRKLWLEHYEEIHRPYNHLKNKCYRVIDVLDKVYLSKHRQCTTTIN